MPEIVRLEPQLAIDCLIFCNKARTRRMRDQSRPGLTKYLLRDSVAPKFPDVRLAQPNLCSELCEGGFTTNGKGVGKTETSHSVQADLFKLSEPQYWA